MGDSGEQRLCSKLILGDVLYVDCTYGPGRKAGSTTVKARGTLAA